MLALSVAVPVAAISVDSKDVPSEAEAGSTVEASVELSDLYTENDEWQVNVTTELENKPKWTLELVDVSGDVVERKTAVGQNVTFSDAPVNSPVSKVRLTVEGEAPAVGNWSYDDQPSFTVLSVGQVPVTSDGGTGSASTIESYSAFHYTSESKEARDAIDSASNAIAAAEEAGADTSGAEGALSDAKRFYQNSDFDAAVSNAEEASELANEAKAQQQSSQQTQQLLIYAGVGVVVLALIGGGVYWYRQNQQDTSRLG